MLSNFYGFVCLFVCSSIIFVRVILLMWCYMHVNLLDILFHSHVQIVKTLYKIHWCRLYNALSPNIQSCCFVTHLSLESLKWQYLLEVVDCFLLFHVHLLFFFSFPQSPCFWFYLSVKLFTKLRAETLISLHLASYCYYLVMLRLCWLCC